MNNIGHVKLTDGLLETIKRDLIPGLLEELNPDGGFSVNLISGKRPDSGFMVSIAGCERVYDLVDVDAAALVNYIDEFKPVLERPGLFLGAWVNGCLVYLDVSINVENRDKALEIGRDNNQLAIYDLAANESISVESLIYA